MGRIEVSNDDKVGDALWTLAKMADICKGKR
jgi:hypothetical protein